MRAKKHLLLTSVVLLMSLAASAQAGPLEDASAAYQRRDFSEAAKWYRAAADHGDAEAQFRLGILYYFGQGVPQDNGEAVKWYRRAAEQGVALAQGSLGAMYGSGRGVPQNYGEAVKWYRRAAEQGVAEAQIRLGFMYYEGKGVPPDYVEAHKWLNLAATNGLSDAAKGRDTIENVMTPEQIAEAQNRAREWKPRTVAPKP